VHEEVEEPVDAVAQGVAVGLDEVARLLALGLDVAAIGRAVGRHSHLGQPYGLLRPGSEHRRLVGADAVDDSLGTAVIVHVPDVHVV